MEAVLKNLAHTAELLAVAAHSDVVRQWDRLTVSRAFHWARYCELLFSRFHTNPAIRRAMEQQLQLTGESLRAAIPAHTELSFLDLPRCQHLLLVGLLNNPELPCSILKVLFDPAGPSDATPGEYEDVTGLCSSIIQCRSACKVLSAVACRSALGADAEVQGGMLMERLDALLSRGSDNRRAEQFLGSVLQGFGAAEQQFCLVISAALLTRTNSAAQTASQDFLLNWLQSEHSVLHRMCSTLPAALLADLAKEHQKFSSAYFDVLKTWASGMEYDINDGEWVQTSTNCTVTFQKLTEHFSALLESTPSVKTNTENKLHALKVSDGDFDVRGLSVWGDLLLALNKVTAGLQS
ncbi:Fanconi anemia group F protein [Salarias fasciatus]|uniref:FA complementation group F n=1 Tax=Salarias fasciatus TaxID=181472 RepID=A0A672HNA0_SALFA|nr:Fanconi anemia group F protein [Salarias fasciatus]